MGETRPGGAVRVCGMDAGQAPTAQSVYGRAGRDNKVKDAGERIISADNLGLRVPDGAMHVAFERLEDHTRFLGIVGLRTRLAAAPFRRLGRRG